MKNTNGNELTDLPNIGKVLADKLKQIGIKDKKDFLARDPYEVFTQLLVKVDSTLCRCALASIVGAKENVPWNIITKISAKEFEKRNPKHCWGKC